MPDRIDDDRPEEHTPTEGVRILGAQEAQVAAGWASEPSASEPPRPRRTGPDSPVTPAARFPLPASRRGAPPAPTVRPVPLEQEARFVEEDQPVEQWRPQPVDSPPLPHWTEPPTGEVPRIDDDLRGSEPEPAWMSMTGSQPRFRVDPSSWGDTDFDEDFKDETTSLGALVEPEPAPDEDEEFAAAVAARRTPRRAAPARPGWPRPRGRDRPGA